MVQGKLENAKDITGADVIFNVKGMDFGRENRQAARNDPWRRRYRHQLRQSLSARLLRGCRWLKVLGTFVEVGNAMEFMASNQPEFNLSKVVFSRNARITSLVANYPKTFDRAFRLLKRHETIPFHRLITHEFYKLEDLLPTMKKMGDENYLKGVLINKD